MRLILHPMYQSTDRTLQWKGSDKTVNGRKPNDLPGESSQVSVTGRARKTRTVDPPIAMRTTSRQKKTDKAPADRSGKITHDRPESRWRAGAAGSLTDDVDNQTA